ncbi:MAG: DNA primase, partial [Ignavibacteriae bacterium]|nr:DNA primase [Ignavibacteriota bacterium]
MIKKDKTVTAVLEDILSHIRNLEKVKFSEFLANPEKKPTNAEYHVLIIDSFLSRIPEKYGFIWHNQLLLYNGTYWEEVEDHELENFLLDCAISMGAPWLSHKHYRQKEALRKQLISSVNKPNYTSQTAINLLNGTLRFNPTPTLTDFKKDDYLNYQLPFSYDEKAKSELFQSYLNRCLPDQSAQNVLSEYIGYIFINKTTLNLEKFLVLYGTGANGKSVFFEIITALIGSTNITNFSLEEICDKHSFHRAEMHNKKLNYCSEINNGIIRNSGIIKQMASREPISARRPGKSPFIMRNYPLIIFNVNNLPTITDTSYGFYRRLLIIPFTVTIPENERDPKKKKKIIKKELPGI